MTAEAEPSPRDRVLDAGGIRFHYRESGDHPDRPAVILLHGLTGNSWEWDPIATRLAAHDRVLALDQRGHGASSWADGYAAEQMVADLEAVIAALGLSSTALVGHSMGALNAYLLAAREPQLVDRLAIVDFGPTSMTPDATAAWTSSLRDSASARFADPDEAHAQWSASNPRARGRELLHFIAHNLARGEDGRWRWRFDAAGLESFLAQVPSEAEQWRALRQVECPTLVIRGRHSWALDDETAARMAAELRHGSLLVIEDGAHDLTVEQPRALAEAIANFLDEAGRV